MNQPKSPQKRALEIQVSFEISRLSSEYLVRTYEQLVPSVHCISPAKPPSTPSVLDTKLTP